MPSLLKILSDTFSKEKKRLDSEYSVSESVFNSRFPDTKEREWIEKNIGVPINKFSDFSSFMSVGHQRVWATYRACKIIASTIVTAKFAVIDKKKSEDVPNPEEYAWFLNTPNPYDSWQEVMEMWVFHMELVGNAYWLKDELDLKGRPTAIYPLLPQYVQVVPSAKEKVAKYKYKINGRELVFDKEDIIHFKSSNPTDMTMGMGSIEPSQSIYNNYINKNAYEERFMENGAQPSGVLVREDAVASHEQWDALKTKFNREYSGTRNAGKTAFLNGKWAYHKLGMTKNEMSDVETEKWTVSEIFLNHGVPLSIVGIEGAANYATSRQDEINFRKYKIVPLLDILVGKINWDGFFRLNKESSICLRYEMSGMIDVEQIVKDYMPLVKEGAMTRNELREKCGLELAENLALDEFLIAANVIPIEMAGFADPEVAAEEEKAVDVRRQRANAEDAILDV